MPVDTVARLDGSAAADEGLGRPVAVPPDRWRNRIRSKPGLGQAYRVGVFVAGLAGIAAGFQGRFFVRSWRGRTTRDVLAAGDAERERIERDLHDGVQQHLTALRVRLSLAAERFGERGETEAGAALQGFSDDVDHVIDEVRDLAHGIYPALLSSFGLAAALVSAGVHSARPVTVDARGVRRCRPEVEIAVYFSCLAALDNAAKYAGGAPVSVDLSETDGALEFTVSDSGAGFHPAETQVGSGIGNMRDRIAAVGGTLTVDSAPARGTRVHGSVPDPGWR